jgi:hypothetical protein
MKMAKYSLPAALVLCAAMVLSIVSCEVFSTSWGEAFERKSPKIEVTADNVDQLLKDARGDTKASRAILKELKGTKKPALRAAAIKAANQASGLGMEMLSDISLLTDALLETGVTGTNGIAALGKKLQKGVKGNDIIGISDDITVILSPVITDTSSGPQFDPAVINSKTVSNADLVFLAINMILAEAEKKDMNFDTYANTWGDGRKVDGTGVIELSPSEKIIAAIAHELTTRDSELGNMLGELLGA